MSNKEWLIIAQGELKELRDICKKDQNLKKESSVFDDGIYWVDPYCDNTGIKRNYIETLDLKHPNICPHCNDNHGRIRQDDKDLYCFNCGWRDAQFFDKRFNKFLKWVVGREGLYTVFEPDNKRERHLRLKQEYYYNHREEILKKQKEYVKAHAEEKKAYKHKWYLEHGKEKQRYRDKEKRELKQLKNNLTKVLS